MHAAVQAVQGTDPAAGDLRVERLVRRVGVVEKPQDVAPHLRRPVGLAEVAHTGCPVTPATSRIHGHSWTGTSAWSGANWKTPWPARAMASAMPISSSAPAVVPGTSSPALLRCSGVRLVLNPSAPARSASSTRAAMLRMSSGVANSFEAPRSPIT
ncbi:hypothetical protein GCM10009836_08010 [Pseudonocardia ailaonensis]|uniref:Uncharacterized protein n=1 Tax=Pseudonocardia ailaonensis TaxID=367279 RepID=A0ABN2MQF0_9PSEU